MNEPKMQAVVRYDETLGVVCEGVYYEHDLTSIQKKKLFEQTKVRGSFVDDNEPEYQAISASGTTYVAGGSDKTGAWVFEWLDNEWVERDPHGSTDFGHK